MTASKTFNGVWRNRIEQTKQQVESKWIGRSGVSFAHLPGCAKLEPQVEQAMKKVCTGKVCEVGCGTGRISNYFRPNRYIGLDINHESLAVAEKRNPKYEFDLIMWEALYPTADTYLFFTVMMHIPDGEIFHIVKKLFNRVVIIESMGRWLRDYGKGNNYQRDPFEYRELFKQIGMKEVELTHCLASHYPYYLDVMVFE